MNKTRHYTLVAAAVLAGSLGAATFDVAVETKDPSVYVLLYMLGGMWLDLAAPCAAECAAVCERSPTAAFI